MPKKFLFFAPGTGEKISDAIFQTGSGGVTSAVTLSAEILAEKGHSVTVASHVDRVSEVRGVKYVPVSDLTNDHTDCLVLLNGWSELLGRRNASRKIYLHYDTRPGGHDHMDKCVDWADIVTVQSHYGVERALTNRPVAWRQKMRVVPIPIRVGDYGATGHKSGNVLIYSSMPDRGLIHLAKVFPGIRKAIPDCELHITGDFSLYGRRSEKTAFENLFEGIPQVHYHGHVSRKELVTLQVRAKVLAFPCQFPEGFCISAAEAMASGAVPVTSDDFALRTTVGQAGVLIPSNPGGGRRRAVARWLYLRRFQNAVIRLLSDEAFFSEKSHACRNHIDDFFHPEKWYAQFMSLVNG